MTDLNDVFIPRLFTHSQGTTTELIGSRDCQSYERQARAVKWLSHRKKLCRLRTSKGFCLSKKFFAKFERQALGNLCQGRVRLSSQLTADSLTATSVVAEEKERDANVGETSLNISQDKQEHSAVQTHNESVAFSPPKVLRVCWSHRILNSLPKHVTSPQPVNLTGQETRRVCLSFVVEGHRRNVILQGRQALHLAYVFSSQRGSVLTQA